VINRTDDCIYLSDMSDDWEIRGSCILCPWIEGVPDGDLFLFKLEVKPEHRRQGIGTAILKAAQEVARLRGDVAIYLEPKPYGVDWLPHALLFRWYQRHGFAWDTRRESNNQQMVWRPERS
jgi:GNAT superfamily N-acetyltransferase